MLLRLRSEKFSVQIVALAALAALESNKSSIAELMADKVLPAIGRGVLPDLLAKLDLTGKTADARRLRAICKIDPRTGAELCRKVLFGLKDQFALLPKHLQQ